jgi:thioredoxin 1
MPGASDISAKSFHKEVLEANEPIVVEFFSHSCPHCVKFSPVYKKVSEALGHEAKFAKVDVMLNDSNRTLAHQRGVRTVPTLEIFYGGRVIGSIVGYHHYEKVTKALKNFLVKKDRYVGPSTPLNRLSVIHTHEPVPEVNVKDFQIRWFKKTKVSIRDRQLVKRDLQNMSEIIKKALNCAKEEGLENRASEIRLPLPSHTHRDVYLTVEYCNDGWHLILESPTEIIGEIVSRGFPFIQTLEENDIETDVIRKYTSST